MEEFILGDTTAGEFNCTKHMTGAKKLIDEIKSKLAASAHRNWPFKDTFSAFGGRI